MMILAACGRSNRTARQAVVEVDGEILYRDEIPASLFNRPDSSLALKQYVDNWIREQVFIRYARQNVDTQRVEKLIKAYRNDLLRDMYENQLKIKLRDSIRIGENELKSYYNLHYKNFIADDTILRWRYILLDAQDPDRRKIRKLFYSDNPADREELESFFSHFAAFKLDTAGWYTYAQAKEIVPSLPRRNLKPGHYVYSQKKHLYLVDIKKIVYPGEILPYDYMRNQLKKYVMEQKLQEEIRRLRNEMVEKAYQNHYIKYHKP